MTHFGIDVSRHNGPVDWQAVAYNGIAFAFARAMLATTPDATFPGHLAGMRSSGVLPGAYHFLYPAATVAPEAQCDLFLDAVGDPTGILLALDVEKDGTAYPRGSDVDRFVARFRERTDHPLILYAPAWYWAQIGNPPAAQYGPLWHSRYVPTTGWYQDVYTAFPDSWWTVNHGGWTDVTIAQYSSASSVAGVSGNCDANAYRGSWADLAALAGIAPEEGSSMKLWGAGSLVSYTVATPCDFYSEPRGAWFGRIDDPGARFMVLAYPDAGGAPDTEWIALYGVDAAGNPGGAVAQCGWVPASVLNLGSALPVGDVAAAVAADRATARIVWG